jgi:photosystem II stability/assembly factor-like uncharacterized protein
MSIQRAGLRSVLVAAIATLLLPAAITGASATAPSVGAVAVDPSDALTIYAGTTAGVYKTTDGGERWMLIAPQLQGVHTLLIDPTMPSTLVAGVGARGVFRSRDGGATWTSIGVSYWWMPTLTMDPQTGTLYTTVDEFGVLRWDSDQELWIGVFSVLQWLPAEYGWTYCVAVQGPALYVGVFYGTWDVAATAVYSSLNGMSFTELDTYPPTDSVPVDVIALDPANPRTAYASVSAGLFKTTDGGATWSRSSSLGSGVRNIIVDPNRSNTVYAVFASGVAKSDDGGLSWMSAHASLTETLLALGASGDVPAFAIDPQTPGTLYAGTAAGVFRTTDGGSHWAQTGLMPQAALASLSIAPTSVISGNAAIATVTLTAPQTSDVSVALSSSDAALATVPPSVTVPAGATSATFAVSTSPVFTSATIEIRASLGDATRLASLLLHAQTSIRDVLVGPPVVGGKPAAGTVYMTRAPGSTEAVEVTLASSNPAVASVPASVIVPGDMTWADFPISTSPVASTTAVTLSATYRSTKSAVHTIRAAVVSSVALSPASVRAGSSSNGIVTLTGVAPSGGTEVAFSSSNPGTATVLASVTVAAGQTSANFAVSTGVCAFGSATISATSAGVTESAVLTVTSAVDYVTVQQAQYVAGKRELRLDVTSTSTTATLSAFVTSSGAWIGQLTNSGAGSYRGRFVWPVNPQNVTVRSSSCGSAAARVTSN